MNCCSRSRKRRSKACANWCVQKWRTFTRSAFPFWWRLGWGRTGATWINDHSEPSAFDGFSQVPSIADALNAPQAQIRPGKNGVGEFEQSEKHQRQGHYREQVREQEHQGG